MEAQTAAAEDLNKKFSALSERVAALEKCSAKARDDAPSSSDDAGGDVQQAKCARSASGKARPRSPSPAQPVPPRGPQAARARASSIPSRMTPPPTSSAAGSAKELVLFRLAGLKTWATASKAWQAMVGALPAGTPAPVEVAALAVHDYITVKYRDRDAADASYRTMTASPLAYKSSKGKELKAAAIRVEPPAIRRRGVALSPFYQAIENAFPDVMVTQNHRTKATRSASTFLVECAADGMDEFIPVATVMWRDIGTEVVITECDVDDSAPALRNLVP